MIDLSTLDNVLATDTEKKKKTTTNKVVPVANTSTNRLSGLDNILGQTPTARVAETPAPVVAKPKGLIASIAGNVGGFVDSTLNKVGNFFDKPVDKIAVQRKDAEVNAAALQDTLQIMSDSLIKKRNGLDTSDEKQINDFNISVDRYNKTLEDYQKITKESTDALNKAGGSPEAIEQYKKDSSFLGITKNFLKDLPSSFVEHLPLGVGEIFKQVHSMEISQPSDFQYLTPKSLIQSTPRGLVDFGTGVVKGLASVPLTVAGIVSGLSGGETEIRFNVKGLGEVSNLQARIVDRYLNGDNATEIGLTEGVGELMNGLWLYSILRAPFVSRPTTIAETTGEQTSNLMVNKGTRIGSETPESATMKSFREYKPPTVQSPVYTELNPTFVAKLKGEGVNMSKYNPEIPTFFRFKMGEGGQITGEIVQVKPSYFNTIKGSLSEKIKTAPESAFEAPLYTKTIAEADLAQAAKNPTVRPVEGVSVGTPSGIGAVETPHVQAYTASLGALATSTPAQVRDNLAILENQLKAGRAGGVTPPDETALVAEINATKDVINRYNAAQSEIIINVPNGNGTPLANVTIVPYGDGQYTLSVSADINGSGMDTPFGEVYPTRDAAINAAKEEIKDWLTTQKANATPEQLSQITQIEKSLTSKKAKSPDNISVKTGKEPLVKSDVQEKYPTIHEGGKIKMVEGELVEIVEGVKTFLHKGDGGWIVSEVSTGRFLAESITKEGAIAKAHFNIDGVGKEKFLELLKEKQLKPSTKGTQKEAVKKSVTTVAKSIKQIADETKILEPNVRRILGVGAKDGTFERVDNGVYVLKNNGKEIAYIEANDAVVALARLASEGKKYNSVILDPAYFSRALIGGNRGIKDYTFILPAEFDKVMKSVASVVENPQTQVYLMLSGARTAQPDMTKYVKSATDAGFKVVGEGAYTKLNKDKTPVTNVRGVEAASERLILMSLSGDVVVGEIPVNLNFRFVRPSIAKSYQTEKPAALMKALIEQSTLGGESVLDPFAGSGVTGAEAIKSGRVPTLVEKNASVVENIIKPRVVEAIKTRDTLNTEIKPLQAEVGLGEDAEGLLTTKEIEQSGKAVKLLKEEVSQVSKKFVAYQNGLYLEPTSAKRAIINGKRINVGKTKPILTKTAVRTLLKSAMTKFGNKPELIVATKGGKKVLVFQGTKDFFSIYPSAFGLIETNLVDGQIIKINPETFKVSEGAGLDRLRVNQYEKGTQQSGSFASMDKFRETMKPVEEAIEKVNPIEFPELVRLARELMGNFPTIKLPRFRPSLGGRPFGVFYPKGDGSITLNPEIFKEGNEEQVAKTLAHELGHLIDYLPEGTMARGNIMGRLAVLRNFGKDLFEGAGVTRSNTEMRRELWALSQYWKPVDLATASKGYLEYRKSPAEIYADFISVLFNDPKLAADMAPESYNTFFKRLDEKPEVKSAYFELQDLLNGSTEDLMRARQADIRKGFARGEDIQAGFAAKKEARTVQFWERLRQQLDDVNYPILKKQNMAEAAGHVFTEADNPRFILQEQSLADNENFLLVDEIDKNIVKPIEKAGMVVEDMGEFLLLDRIINERVNIANPFGFNTKNAPKQLDFLKSTLGEKKFDLLTEKVQTFHDLVYKSVEEAVRVGSYNTELFNTKIKPNKNHYASFQVLDYMQDFMPATIKAQTGTLKEVANPFISTILKTVSLNRLNAYQRAKNATISMLKANFAEEIKLTKRITSDGKLSIFKPAKDRGALQVLEDGRLQSYDVDPYIAESFKRDKVGDLNMLVSLVDKFNNKLFKPVVTTYNLGFALAFNPARDFKRTYKSIPNATVANLLTAYVKSFPEAVKYAKGELSEFTKSLVDSKAINAPVNNYNFDARDDELSQIMKKYGLITEDAPFTNKNLELARKKIIKPITQVLEGIRFMANTFEVISKIGGAKVRISGGEGGKQLAYNVRNYTGTPNFKTRGAQTATTNAIFVFSNITKEGLKSDFRIATDPKTRSGYWWKTVKIDLMPKFLMFLASAGFLGAGIKSWFDKVSEYDKSNYLVIPLGTNEDGKAVYMRIPHDETGRLISTVFWKMANFIKDGETSDLQDIFAVGAGQLPSISPAIEIGTNWLQYLSGRNPYDAFHGRTLIDDTTWQAGGGAALMKMVKWTTNSLGFTKFATYDTSKNTGTETFMQVAPFFSSLIKITDYGETEKLKNVGADVKQDKAKQNLLEREVVAKYIKQANEEGTLSLSNVSQYSNLAVLEILGHMPESKDEQDHAKRITQKFKAATKRDLADDPRYIAIIDAQGNDEKKAILKSIKDDSTAAEYEKIQNDLLQLKIVTPEVLYSVE